jgi:hypothetical protein
MPKKTHSTRLQQRMRQKMTWRKMILIVSCLTCLNIGLVVFMNLFYTDKTKAGNSNAVKIYVVDEPVYLDSKTIETPVVKQMPVSDEHTLYMRKAKVLSNTNHNAAN